MARIDFAVDRGGEDDAPMFLQACEGIPPFRRVRGEAGTGDGDEASTGRQASQRRGDMTIGGVGHAPGDVGHHRKWWVHQHDAGNSIGVQIVVDLGRIEACDRKGWKEGREKRAARLGQLVEMEPASGNFGENGEQAGAGRRFQHDIVHGDRGGGRRGESQGDRRRELLEGLALFGTAGVRGLKAGNLGEQRQCACWRAGFAEKRLSVFAQKQDGGAFANVIGGLPIPGAIGIGAAEGSIHRDAERGRVDALTLFKKRKELTGGAGERRRGNNLCHGENLGRAGTGQAGRRSLFDRTGSNPSRQPSPSQGSGGR